MAYFFVGAQDSQLAQVQLDVVGVPGKLALLSASLLGEADTSEKVAGFTLLILDPASVPKNQKRLIFAGRQPKCSIESNSDYEVEGSVDSMSMRGLDFTSHIEPDWDYDVNHSLVVYRYQGRIVHKISPVEIEGALLKWFPRTIVMSSQTEDEATPRSRSTHPRLSRPICSEKSHCRSTGHTMLTAR